MPTEERWEERYRLDTSVAALQREMEERLPIKEKTVNEPTWINAAAKRIVSEWEEFQREAAEKYALDPEAAQQHMRESVAHLLWCERRRAGEV
jgi:hypothetical protein